MNILVIDAQGGGVGKQLVTAIKQTIPHVLVTAVGTNSAATSAMLKAGVACRKADVIVGPIGIVIADSLLGEITPSMAAAVGQSRAKRILIPFNHCDTILVGVSDFNIGKLVKNAVTEIQALI